MALEREMIMYQATFTNFDRSEIGSRLCDWALFHNGQQIDQGAPHQSTSGITLLSGGPLDSLSKTTQFEQSLVVYHDGVKLDRLECHLTKGHPVVDGCAHTPRFDAVDGAILHDHLTAWARRHGPRVGDFVQMPDGKARRFSHDWGDSIQVSEGGSFYLDEGAVSFSGGLEPSIPKSLLWDTLAPKNGDFWFFHHNHARAHNGVYFRAPCRQFVYNTSQVGPIRLRSPSRPHMATDKGS